MDRLASAFVEITSLTPVTYSDAVLGMVKLVEAHWPLRDPRCSLRFVVSWRDGSLRIGYEAASQDPDLASLQLERFRSVAHGVAPWLGLAAVTTESPWAVREPLRTTFVAGTHVSAPIVSRSSLPWRSGHAHEGAWVLVVDILASGSGPAYHDEDPGHGSDEREPAEVTAFVTSATSSSTVLTDVRLYGSGASGAVIEALLAADVSADGRLVPVPAREAVPVPVAELPIQLLGHVLATPARVDGMFPDRSASSADEAFDLMDASPTPHQLFVGASGQGKTTGLGERGRRAIESGEVVVAVDVHDGDFVRRLYQASVAAGRSALYIDWTPSEEGERPTIRMAEPPTGVSKDQHVEDQWTMLRHDVWPDADAEWFGPVSERVTRVGLALAIHDPTRRFTLSCMPRLLDPNEGSYRAAVLQRVGHDELTRAVEREVMPMLTTKDPNNTAAWIIAKFAPFTTPTLRQILEGRRHRVPIEEALAAGCSIFVHAPAGQLGDDASRILVAVLLNRVWAAVRRGCHGAPVTLLLDEWQRYASRLTTMMLAEGRKFDVRLVMANQNLAQLPLQLRESVLSNTGAIAAYRLGPSDAAVLDGFYPTLPMRVMLTLPRHTFALTTFEADLVATGPTPLPESRVPVPPWQEQLHAFWDGPEPDTTEDAPACDDSEGDSEATEADTDADEPTFFDRWLHDRATRVSGGTGSD